jgi:hypothetical protein
MTRAAAQASFDTSTGVVQEEEEDESHFHHDGDFYNNDHPENVHVNFSDEDAEAEDGHDMKRPEAEAVQEHRPGAAAQPQDACIESTNGHISNLRYDTALSENDTRSVALSSDPLPEVGSTSENTRTNGAQRYLISSEEPLYIHADSSKPHPSPSSPKLQNHDSLLQGGQNKRPHFSPAVVDPVKTNLDTRRVPSQNRAQSLHQVARGQSEVANRQYQLSRHTLDVLPEHNSLSMNTATVNSVAKNARSSGSRNMRQTSMPTVVPKTKNSTDSSIHTNMRVMGANRVSPQKSATPSVHPIQQQQQQQWGTTAVCKPLSHTLDPELAVHRHDHRAIVPNSARFNGSDNGYPITHMHISSERENIMQPTFSSEHENQDVSSTATTMSQRGETHSVRASVKGRSASSMRISNRPPIEQLQSNDRRHSLMPPANHSSISIRSDRNAHSNDALCVPPITTDVAQAGMQEMMLQILRMQQERNDEKKHTKTHRHGPNYTTYYGGAREQVHHRRSKSRNRVVPETNLSKAQQYLWAPFILWFCVGVILLFYCIFYFNVTALTALLVLLAMCTIHTRDFFKEMKKTSHDFGMSQIYTARKPIEFRMKYLHRTILCILNFIRKMILTIPFAALVWYAPFVAMFSSNLWTNFDNLSQGAQAVCLLHVIFGAGALIALYYALTELLRWVSHELREVITSIPGCQNVLLADIERDVILLPNIELTKPSPNISVAETIEEHVINNEVRAKGNKPKEVHDIGRNVEEQKDGAYDAPSAPLASPSAVQNYHGDDYPLGTNAPEHIIDFSSDSGSDSNDNSDSSGDSSD